MLPFFFVIQVHIVREIMVGDEDDRFLFPGNVPDARFQSRFHGIAFFRVLFQLYLDSLRAFGNPEMAGEERDDSCPEERLFDFRYRRKRRPHVFPLENSDERQTELERVMPFPLEIRRRSLSTSFPCRRCRTGRGVFDSCPD
jgi:hypothetical protein